MANAGKLAQRLSQRIGECEALANAATREWCFHKRAARDALEKANAQSGATQAFKLALQDLQRQEAAEQQAAEKLAAEKEAAEKEAAEKEAAENQAPAE